MKKNGISYTFSTFPTLARDLLHTVLQKIVGKMAVFGVENVRKRVVPGYGGSYEVGEDGSVWRDGRMLQQVRGYVNLSWKGRMDKVKVSYLVARVWVANAECRPYVRHRNGDAGDNRAENLEWCEEKERAGGRRSVELGPVSVWTKDSGELVGSWGRLEDACMALGVDPRGARRQLRGGARSVNGYIFKV